MAVTLKATFFFEARSRAGWTENWYFGASAFPSIIPYSAGGFTITNRRAILGTNYNFTAIRVTQDFPVLKNQSLVLNLTNSQGRGTFAYGTGEPQSDEQPFDALLCRVEAGPGSRRSFLLRGLPEGILTPDAQYLPTAAWNTAFNNYTAYWLTQGYSIKHLGRGPLLRADTYAQDATGTSLILTWLAGVPGTLTPGSSIQVSGVRGVVGVNGRWIVKYVVGNNLYTQARPKQTIYGTPSGTAYVQLLTPAYNPLTTISAERGVKRDTGRPFDQLAGRRKARAG